MNVNNIQEGEDVGYQYENLPPEVQKKIEAYSTGLLNIVYSKETNQEVYEILKSGEPEETIPQASLLINSTMENAVTSKGQKPSLEVVLNSGLILIGELIQVGEAGGFFEISSEEQNTDIVKRSIQAYIQKGLKDKTIDPIELQAETEKMMSDSDKEAMMQHADRAGIPREPDANVAMESYANKKVNMSEKSMLDTAARSGGGNV